MPAFPLANAPAIDLLNMMRRGEIQVDPKLLEKIASLDPSRTVTELPDYLKDPVLEHPVSPRMPETMINVPAPKDLSRDVETMPVTPSPKAVVGGYSPENQEFMEALNKDPAMSEGGEKKAIKDFLSQFKDALEAAKQGTIEPSPETYLPTRDKKFAKNFKLKTKTELGTPSLKYLKKNYGIADMEPGESAEEAIEVGKKLGYRPEDIAHYLVRNYVPGGIEYLEGNGKKPNLKKFLKGK